VVRTGLGIDTHAFAPGRPLILGGVEVPHEQGLAGHSDADVLTHAVIDALLGAAGLGDIGERFPDTDARYAGADSLELLRTVVGELGEHGWEIGNVDATVVLERPKLAAHRAPIRASLASALGLGEDAVNVKATTGERIGFVGRGEGAAALAVATIRPARVRGMQRE
jgi:2-C-methyl-D-erythritol 2,4-cyclodiphosphate synthase